MKTPVYVLFFLVLLLGACHSRPQSSSSEEGEDIEASTDSIEKATAIFWVDKRAVPPGMELKRISTAKARVNIHKNGKIDLLEFAKTQPKSVVHYLTYRLEIFRVKEMMIDSGYVKTGEQYVQLRYWTDLGRK